MTTPYTPGDREFLADFDTPESVRSGVSVDRRPDAIIPDPLVAYTMGPVALGDSSEGPQDRPWRARATATQVLVARANDDNTAWEAETELFSYAGEPIVELDCAFEQNGRAVIVAERDGQVWIYWFDPTISQFVFQAFANGRNPRCLLDNPPDPTDSDVLVFYMSDAGNVGLVFRQQRDRYATEYTTPVVDSTDRYLEDVVKLRDNRIAAVMAINSGGQYTFERLESTLYPYIADVEPFASVLSPISGLLQTLVLEYTTDEEEVKALLVPQSGILADTVLLHTLFDVNEVKALMVPQSGLLVLVVIEHTLFDVNEVKALMAPSTGGTLVVVVITHLLFDTNDTKALLAPQSGSLVNA